MTMRKSFRYFLIKPCIAEREALLILRPLQRSLTNLERRSSRPSAPSANWTVLEPRSPTPRSCPSSAVNDAACQHRQTHPSSTPSAFVGLEFSCCVLLSLMLLSVMPNSCCSWKLLAASYWVSSCPFVGESCRMSDIGLSLSKWQVLYIIIFSDIYNYIYI